MRVIQGFNAEGSFNVAFSLPAGYGSEPIDLAFTSPGVLAVLDNEANSFSRFRIGNSLDAAPTPAADVTRPTIRVKGRRNVDSLRNRVVFRGTATDASLIDRIEYRVAGQRGVQTARGTDRWRAVVRPDSDRRRTTIKVRAVDRAGNKSRPLRLKVFRR